MFLLKEKNALTLKENREKRENKQRVERAPWFHSNAECYDSVDSEVHYFFSIYIGTGQLRGV